MDYFNNIIPSQYVQSKNKPLVVYFALHELYSPTFNDKIISGIHMGHIYTVIVKVSMMGITLLWLEISLILTMTVITK